MGTEEALRTTIPNLLVSRDTQHPSDTSRPKSDSFRPACLRSFAACTRPQGVDPNTPGRPGRITVQQPRPYDYTGAVRGSHGTATSVS